MNRFSSATLLLVMPLITWSQDLATEVRIAEAAPGVYMIDGANGFSSNMGLVVGEERVVLIDDGMAPITASLMDAVANLAERPIDIVVNTHVHGDHIGSNATLAENGAIVVAHDNLRERLVESTDLAGGPAGLPVVTFDDAVTFYVNGLEAHAFHIRAAHTDGDAVVYLRDANVMVTGDLMFNYLFPYIDIENGGSVDGFIAGQQRILDMANDETVIIPGHGELAKKADLQAALDMLVDARSRVEALVDEGLSQEEVLARNPLEDYHEKWNWGFITTERMTETLFRSLTTGGNQD